MSRAATAASPDPDESPSLPIPDRLSAVGDRLRRSDVSLLRRLGSLDRVSAAIASVVVVGLVLRLAFLGARTAHYDEGRVGYWTIHFMETGEFHYRIGIHGPFVQHVNAALFELLGATDVTLRLVVALIGGFLPLAVLLIRKHLDDVELVAAGFFLAFDPALLYYSRFLRSTVPVAVFSFVAFGFLVRYLDGRRLRNMYAAVFFLALAFTTKESAAVYILI